MRGFYSALALLVRRIVMAATECLQIIYTSNLKNSSHSFALGFEEDQIFVQQLIRNCYEHFVFIYCRMVFIRTEVQK
jgi:hypothetical protein